MPAHFNALSRTVIAALVGLVLFQVARAQTSPTLPGVPGPPDFAAPAAPASVSSQPDAGNQESAPSTYISPSIAALVTGTNNANFGAGSGARGDAIFELVPSLVLRSDHAHVHLDGNFSVDGAAYARGTQENRVLPSGSLNLGSELVNRFLYFDAGIQAQQNLANPFAGRFSNASGPNQFTSLQYRVSPYVDRSITSTLRLYARSDETWTQVTNNPTATGIFGGHYFVQTVRVEQKPVPLGYTLQAQQTESKYTNLPHASLRDTTFRGIGNVQVTDRLQLGAIGGYERVQEFLANEKRPIYGLRSLWQPNPTGRVEATAEYRYFGTGWEVAASQTTGMLTLRLNSSRGPTTFLSSQFNSAAGTSITSLLDGILATQYPNPVARTKAVQELLAGSGLPSTLSTAGNLYTQVTNLTTAVSLTALVVHERNSYSLSVYRDKIKDLFLPGQTLLQALQTLSNDTTQTGVALGFARRLTPLTNFNFTASYADDNGFDVNRGRHSRQTSVIAELDHRINPSTTVLVGLRWQNLVARMQAHTFEYAGFVGLEHRF